jgi:GH25 family lysozyme M1 (1,4-beta-N-acetylmuramidase)
MRRAQRTWLPIAVAVLSVLALLPTLAAPTEAATGNWTAKCDARVRLKPYVSAKTVRILPAGTIIRAAGTKLAGYYEANCPSFVRGSSWLKVIAINGKTTTSLYGRTYVWVATKLFKSGPNPTATPKPTATASTTTNYMTNCETRLRSSTSTSSDTRAIIPQNEVVTASAKVTGGSWTADCPDSLSGSTWYKITAVGGTSTSSLYGVSAVYAATGLFRSVSTTSGYKEGIDVSHWQGTIDWTKVKLAGKSFSFAKATEGVGFKDDKYATNKAGAMGQGIKFGAYHFARPGNNPVTEADWFVNNMGLQRGMLIPALDIEVTDGLGPTALTNWTKAWLQRVTDRTGVKPMIYTSPAFWRNNLNDSRWFADNGYSILWVAHWNTTSPSVPGSNWGGKSWTFWQYTSDGSVPGISGRVDLNRYRFSTFDAVTY